MPPQALWELALAQVPGSADETPAVQVLAGGTANSTHRVRTRHGSFVVRLHEPHTLELGVDRRREAALHGVAAQAGLAPAIVAADPAGRYLVTQFIDAPVWHSTDMHDEGHLRHLAQQLATLHALPAPAVAPLDLEALMERHVVAIHAADPPGAAQLAPLAARAHLYLEGMARSGRRSCIVHNDLNHANLLGTDRLFLIDWEYAAVADPLCDLACLLAYYPQAARHSTLLLSRSGLACTATATMLAEAAWVYVLLAYLWYRRRELAGSGTPAEAVAAQELERRLRQPV